MAGNGFFGLGASQVSILLTIFDLVRLQWAFQGLNLIRLYSVGGQRMDLVPHLGDWCNVCASPVTFSTESGSEWRSPWTLKIDEFYAIAVTDTRDSLDDYVSMGRRRTIWKTP